jgi:hypothetical protein
LSANVRCTGTWHGDAFHSCGWKGERFAIGKLTEEQERTLREYTPTWYDAVREADHKAWTAKPCPRCGGTVQLIPEVER